MNSHSNESPRPTPPPPPDPPSFHELGVDLSNLPDQELHWLWRDRIFLGKLTLLDGDPGLGKSLLTLDLAARLTTGQPMPDGTPGLLGNVILIAPEDSAADTIRPRLIAAGGDPSRVRLLNIVKYTDRAGEPSIAFFTLSKHLTTLIKTIHDTHALLVIIDPLMAVLGKGLNSSRDQDIRSTFNLLSLMAERSNCAILIVRHLNKGNFDNPLYRGSGSIGIIAAARTALLVAPDPHDEKKRILATTKNNLAEKPANLTYQVITNAHGHPAIHWLGTNSYPLASLLKGNIHLSPERQDLLKALQQSNRPLSPKELAEQTERNHKQVRQLLRLMLNAGDIISPAYGLYTTHHHPSTGTSFSENVTASPTTLSTLSTVSHPDSTSDVASSASSTLSTVSLPDSTLIPSTLSTPSTVSHPDSNFTLPLPPNLAGEPLTSEPVPTPFLPLETIIEKLRPLFYCSHPNHYLHWLLSETKIGCPICDTWLAKDAATTPITHALYTILTQHPPHPTESRTAWLQRITPLLP